MVIRSIREHVAEHNWFAVGIDLAIVVVGVFLGTQVNNWNEERLDRKRSEEYRARLIEELDFNARQYALQAAYFRQAKAYGLDAIASLNGDKPLSDLQFVIAAYQLTQSDTTQAKTGVRDEMVANGLGGYRDDVETEQVASDFYLTVEVSQRLLETSYPYRNLLREVMPYDVQVAIREACGDRSVYYNGRLVGIRLVVPCSLSLPGPVAAEAARAVRQAPAIRQQMTRYVAFIDEKLTNLDLASEQARNFRDRLMKAAGRSST